ncbi:DUF3549 family protein [Paraglaciecola sp. 2405UD69-4]|uniref:DUF3549 family protein n=1 Tax=Paraglaciecola sp. 2405UD69-4 TaxID=3391836 RepID=UPI0039C9E3B9
MSHINTISEFLLHAGTQCHVFDMARGIKGISSQEFLEIERAQVPAPRPRQQHAWFGLLFFNKSASSEHYIWFVKLPLDEKGLVIEAGRQQFLQIVVEALGETLNNEANPNNQLPDNPFTFVPGQQLLADFNSLCKAKLELPFSEHLTTALQHIEKPAQQDWRDIPLQGITDFCASLNNPNTQEIFLSNFQHLAQQLQIALCSSLENHPVNAKLSEFIINWAQQESNNLDKLQSSLRALSQSQDSKSLHAFILCVLKSEAGENPTILMLIAARHWKALVNQDILTIFIEGLAKCAPEYFGGLYADLVQIPEIRQVMLSVLRWPDKSPNLTTAIGKVFGQ